MFHNYGYEVSTILKQAEEIRYQLRHPYVGTEHLLLSILKDDNEVSNLLKEYGVSYESFLEELLVSVGQATKAQEINLYTPMLRQILEVAQMSASSNPKGIVTPSHIFLAMLEEGEGIAYRILLTFSLPVDEVYSKIKKNVSCKEKKDKNLEIYKVGVPLSFSSDTKIVGRESEMTMMIETLLRRQKNNPLLIGKAGVGKTALVEELARRIKYHEVPDELEGMEIIFLEMGSLVAGTKYRGEFEERLHKIIKEVKEAQNIILFIDEIHTMVNAGGAEGAIAAADIFKPYLARGDIKVIGATTLEEYHQYFEKDKALDRRFEKIKIDEPMREDMLVILNSLRPSIESHYGVSLSDESLNDFLDLSDEYLFSRSNPDKTIELIDSVCARVKLKNSQKLKLNSSDELEKIKKRKEKCIKLGDYEAAIEEATLEDKIKKEISFPVFQTCKITRDDILEMVEIKTHSRIRVSHKEIMESLHDHLFQGILGQDKALQQILDVMESPKRKGTSFLLVGGSGVGKTETVKIISDTLKTHLIRIDMSEYSSSDSINKLIGAPSGYVGYEDGYVFQELRETPFSTILFDEIEKAHPKVLNLLLQILDEGFVTDRRGEKIYFHHTFIFLTSNAVSRSGVGFATSFKENFDGIFSKELLGRIDQVIEYAPISVDIANAYIEKNLKNPDISKEELLLESDIERYGLRNIRNLIHKYNKRVDYQEQ